MLYRIIVATAIVSASGVVSAQTPVDVQISADERHQLRVFEGSLRTAIDRAASNLAKRAREVAPNIQLQFEAEARIVGIVLPQGEGYQFSVDVPGIEPSTVGQWELSRLLAGRLDVANNPPARVTPMIVLPDSNTVLMTNPVKEYSDFAHDALVDTMLDSAFALPIREGQTLTLIVGNGRVGLPVDPLAAPERMLYLRMKGEDLIALRQNRIPRDDAKKRILEWRY